MAMPSAQQLDNLEQNLISGGFEGDIERNYAERVVAATDNSIYQALPLAILYPRTEADIQRALKAIHRHREHGFSLTARGGGTGTNGQSLSDNLLLDCSRYLTRVVDFDAASKVVTAQPGVTLDQLNAFLAAHDLFFPIDISSSSRATLGGMVATDASGSGSPIYGKTSDHIESITLVLADGAELDLHDLSIEELESGDGLMQEILQPIYRQLERHRGEIDRVFPVMNRGLSGYNLQHPITRPGHFNPCYLVAGAEGTLGIVKRISLRALRRPGHRMLTVVFYRDFERALAHIQPLLESEPAAIEMLDDKILDLARGDAVWFDVQQVLDLPVDDVVRAAHFIEHVGHSEDEIERYRERLEEILRRNDDFAVILGKTETNPATISALWNLRKRAVGLLGRSQDERRAVPFVEDCAVPPQNLIGYVAEFRRLLDEYRLDYGMYGHADAGVLHVRPMLDLMQARDRKLLRELSDRVARLTLDHGGVLWGEHGRGFRGEYGPLYFGETLYQLLRDIKKSFDPFNLLNPGKLVSLNPSIPITPMDGVMLRGELDEQIKGSLQVRYRDTLFCNGNGACFNNTSSDAMCPSYKATGNKLFSPKGRAALLREWIRLKSRAEEAQLGALEQQLQLSLKHCLSCKSCTANCPLKVNIPELKSRFLHEWHTTRNRPFTDWFIRYFEPIIALGARMPWLFNALLHGRATRSITRRVTGLERLPRFSSGNLQDTPLPTSKLKSGALGASDVILLRDNYLNSFDRDTLQSAASLLRKLGYRVHFSDVIYNGKLLHVKGMREAFRAQAEYNVGQLQRYQNSGAHLVSLETMTQLMMRQEYREILGREISLNIRGWMN